MAKKVIKLDVGSIYQKEEGGVYFFRYQINRRRKAVSLKTKNKDEAIKQAESLLPVVKATSTEVICAHVQQARNLTNHQKSIPLSEVLDTYMKERHICHPNGTVLPHGIGFI